MISGVFYLTLPELGAYRRAISAFIGAGSPRWGPKDTEQIVGEVLQNIVRHAYDEKGGAVEVVVRPGLSVSFSDHGGGFDPEWVPAPAFGEQTSGMGLALIRMIVGAEKVLIRSAPGEGATLTLFA